MGYGRKKRKADNYHIEKDKSQRDFDFNKNKKPKDVKKLQELMKPNGKKKFLDNKDANQTGNNTKTF